MIRLILLSKKKFIEIIKELKSAKQVRNQVHCIDIIMKQNLMPIEM